MSIDKITTRGRIDWYWMNETLLTEKGNWRKSPPGVYFEKGSKIDDH